MQYFDLLFLYESIYFALTNKNKLEVKKIKLKTIIVIIKTINNQCTW